MRFADIHSHMLCGVDDGPASEQEMYRMLRAACEDGVGFLCLTPHFHPGLFGDNREKVRLAFEKLCSFAAAQYPQLELTLGNELRYNKGCSSWLAEGLCRTLNGTQYVLVDFSAAEKETNILRGLDRLLSAGYVPVLAHAERYRNLSVASVRDLAGNGVLMQINVQSLWGVFGLWTKQRVRAMLKEGLVDLVCTDAHDLKKRSPQLSRGYGIVSKKYGKNYADAIFCTNALALLCGDSREGNDEK